MRLIDTHAHILPGMDSECLDAETGRRLLNLAREAGVDTLVATPHFYQERHTIEGFIKQRGEALHELGNPGNVISGAEILLSPGLVTLRGLERLCLGKTGVLLIELPITGATEAHMQTVMELRRRGYTILLSHACRYPYDFIDAYLQIGALVQVNAEGVFLDRHRCSRMIHSGKLCALGSDVLGYGTYSPYLKAVKRLGRDTELIMKRCSSMLGL